MEDHAYDNVERRPAMDSEDQADEDLERTSAIDSEDEGDDDLERTSAMDSEDEADEDFERTSAMDSEDEADDDFERWPDMDPELKRAACSGDVDFLRKAVASSKPNAYFLSRFKPTDDVEKPYAGNILHLAVWHRKGRFVKEALSILPEEVADLLLCQQETAGQLSKWNPLHVAVFRKNQSFVDLIVKADSRVQKGTEENVLGRLKESAEKLFTQRDSEGRTPALLALQRQYYYYWVVVRGRAKLIQGIVDNEGNSPLFLAVQNGDLPMVGYLLEECPDDLCASGPNGMTALHVVPGMRIDHWIVSKYVIYGDVLQELFQRFPELIKATDNEGSTVLHTWVKMGCQYDNSNKVDHLKELFEYLFSHHTDESLVFMRTIDKDGNNPLHLTATASTSFTLGPVQIAKQLTDLYKSKRTSNASTSKQVLSPYNDLPWLMKNKNGDTPLLLAIRNGREELAHCFLSVDLEGPLHSFNQNALMHAIDNAWFQDVDKIVDVICRHDDLASLLNFGGANILHHALRFPVMVIKKVVERFPLLISEHDSQGDTPVDKAAKDGAAWLVELMLKKDPISLQKARDGWKIACEKGHLYVILAFLEHCPYFRAFCIGVQDTPLHHIRLGSCAEYQQFLAIHKIIEELRHTRDALGDTPLHKAIKNNNTDLAEALLYVEDIRFDIKDGNGKTAMDLLVENSQHNKWRKMCERVGIDLKLKTTYQQRETKLLNSRETLLVVATLLATITFQAGFTLPGGLNNNSGEAMFAKKPAFLVFLLTDVYVLCSSMLVLFYLLWSMVCGRSRSLELFDRSVMILWQSLYPSLVAFMSGVYIVISHKSLWAATVTIVMCSLVGISATDGTILSDQLLDKLKLLLGKALKFKRGNSQDPSPATSTVISEAETMLDSIV